MGMNKKDGEGFRLRPDGMVAWRSREPVADPAGELWRVLTAVLSR